MKGKGIPNMWGKFNLGEQVTVFPCRGMVQARRLARVIHMPITKRRVETNEVLTVIAYSASELDKKGRSEWGVCAGKYCAYLKGKHSTTRFPWYMQPHSKEPPDWYTFYLHSNLLAKGADMNLPRKKAPMTGSNPPSPYNLWARYDEERRKIVGEVSIHPLQRYDVDFAVRIWLAGQYITSMYQSIHKVIQLGPGPSTDMTKPIIVRFEFDAIRVVGFRFNTDYLSFDDMAYGSIYIYADSVSAISHEHGALASAYSNVEEVMLPRRVKYIYLPEGGKRNAKRRVVFLSGGGLSKKGLSIFHRLRRKMKVIRKRYKAKVIKHKTIW